MVNIDVFRPQVEIALLLLGAVGNLLVWAQADWRDGADDYFGVFIGSLVLVLANTSAVPEQYKVTARTIGLFFLINFQEKAICSARSAFKKRPDGASHTIEQYNTARAGGVLALMSGYALFVERMIIPSTRGAMSRFSLDIVKSIRGICFLGAALSLVVCQGIVWGIEDICTDKHLNQEPLNVTPLFSAALIVLGVIMNDRELLDLSLFLGMFGLVSRYKVIFNDDGTSFKQSNYKALWRAEMSFGFIASLLLLGGQLQQSFRFGRTAGATLKERVLCPPFAMMGTLTLLAVSGAICVFVRSPKSGTATFQDAQQNWYAAFSGFVVPALCIAGWLLNTRAPAMLAFFMAIPVSIFFSALVEGTATGYLRGGAILLMLTTAVIPTVALGEGTAIAPDPKTYFEDKNRTPMVLCLLLLCCGLLWWDTEQSKPTFHNLWVLTIQLAVMLFVAASTGNLSIFKLVVYALLLFLTREDFWPVSRSHFDATPSSIMFIVVGWSIVAFISSAFPGVPFEVFHEDELHPCNPEAQQTFIEPDKPPLATPKVGGKGNGIGTISAVEEQQGTEEHAVAKDHGL